MSWPGICCSSSNSAPRASVADPRRNGQVFLPEDDPGWWRGMSMNDDIEVAVEQMRWIRQVIAKLREVRQVEAS